jgi:hypothetical protein
MTAGENGQIDEQTCSLVPNFIAATCGCKAPGGDATVTESPAAAPAAGPTAPPATTPATGPNPPCNICGDDKLVVTKP